MASLCGGTPEINVRDNRGLDLRTLRYNRDVDGAVAMQYVDAQTFNVLGQAVSSQDPRFFGGATLNFQYMPALSGQVLETVSVDAGTSKACADIVGRPVWQCSQGRDAAMPSNNDITVRLYYDALGRSVRRDRVTADVAAGLGSGDTSDIWCYGDYCGLAGATYDATNTTDPRNANLRGQLFQHFDTAGLVDRSVLGYAAQGNFPGHAAQGSFLVQSVQADFAGQAARGNFPGHAVAGLALREDRRFLATACDATAHWRPGTPQALYGLNKQWLEPDTDPGNLYSTRWSYNALGQAVTQVDAKGHRQQTAFDCAGRKCAASVTPKGGMLTPVTTAVTYTAAGDIDTRSDANNIQVAYAYEPQATQRLISITASRVAAAGGGAKGATPLQAVTYAYDGVGNVTSLSDSGASAQVSFFRNRAVTPDRGYTYDALYQLTSATGRENYVNDTPKGTDWPGGGQFSPSATPNYRPYTRAYFYDLGGNLTTIGSSNWGGAAPPTRDLVVSSNSNRAVCTANNPGATQANIDTYFDPAGKSICLDANRNQPMYWTALHQLYCVATTYRPPTGGTATAIAAAAGAGIADWQNSDREQYAYDGSGQRVRKYVSSMASGGTWNSLDTRYLPGLELRSNTATTENLEVIVLDDGARVLNWAGGTGKPSDIPNLQLRYQYADRQNSCRFETDDNGNVITQEEYYPYGGTAVLASRSNSEVNYKYLRYCGKERDATGLYYYGLRYYQPWIGRWINPDPAGTVDGQNLYCMVNNNPCTYNDAHGLVKQDALLRGTLANEPATSRTYYRALTDHEAKWLPVEGVTGKYQAHHTVDPDISMAAHIRSGNKFAGARRSNYTSLTANLGVAGEYAAVRAHLANSPDATKAANYAGHTNGHVVKIEVPLGLRVTDSRYQGGKAAIEGSSTSQQLLRPPSLSRLAASSSSPGIEAPALKRVRILSESEAGPSTAKRKTSMPGTSSDVPFAAPQQPMPRSRKYSMPAHMTRPAPARPGPTLQAARAAAPPGWRTRADSMPGGLAGPSSEARRLARQASAEALPPAARPRTSSTPVDMARPVLTPNRLVRQHSADGSQAVPRARSSSMPTSTTKNHFPALAGRSVALNYATAAAESLLHGAVGPEHIKGVYKTRLLQGIQGETAIGAYLLPLAQARLHQPNASRWINGKVVTERNLSLAGMKDATGMIEFTDVTNSFLIAKRLTERHRAEWQALTLEERNTLPRYLSPDRGPMWSREQYHDYRAVLDLLRGRR